MIIIFSLVVILICVLAMHFIVKFNPPDFIWIGLFASFACVLFFALVIFVANVWKLIFDLGLLPV